MSVLAWTSPRTRSRSSPSVTTQSRMPGGDAQLQRGLHVLGDVDRHDRRDRGHHLTGLLLVQVKDAREHACLPRVEVPAGMGLGDQALELIRRAAARCSRFMSTPSSLRIRVGNRRQAEDDRAEQDAERPAAAGRCGGRPTRRGRSRRTLAPSRRRSAARRSRSRRRSPRRSRRPRRGRVLPPRALPAARARASGVASAPIPIEVIVTPICTAEMYSLMRSSCSSASAGAAQRLLAHQLQTRAAGAHERILGDHEERVDRDQHGREDQLQPTPDRSGRRPRRDRPRCYSGRLVFAHRWPAPSQTVAGAARRRSRGEREVGVGEAALGVRGELQAHLVPAVHEYVRVVVGVLRQRGDAVDEGDRRAEVGELVLAHDRVALVPAPLAAGAMRCSISASASSAICIRRGYRRGWSALPHGSRPVRVSSMPKRPIRPHLHARRPASRRPPRRRSRRTGRRAPARDGERPVGARAPASAPPIRPPMCAPTEMLGSGEAEDQVEAGSAPRYHSASRDPRARSSTAAAPISPKTAPEAPRLGVAVRRAAPRRSRRAATRSR